MFRSAQFATGRIRRGGHDKGGRRFNAFNTSTNHSDFSTSVRSTRFPLAMLRPLVENVCQLVGRFAKSVSARDVGKMTKREPGALMNSGARRLFSGVRKPFTRDRKYQTRLGSSNSTEANCIFGCKDTFDS